jgi:hypothetical protein
MYTVQYGSQALARVESDDGGDEYNGGNGVGAGDDVFFGLAQVVSQLELFTRELPLRPSSPIETLTL